MTANKKTDINPNGVQIMKTCLDYMGQNVYKFLISQNILADFQITKTVFMTIGQKHTVFASFSAHAPINTPQGNF